MLKNDLWSDGSSNFSTCMQRKLASAHTNHTLMKRAKTSAETEGVGWAGQRLTFNEVVIADNAHR